MKLSIIYPYRNREVFRVRKSLQSLLDQLNSDSEIVFIDYGSDTPLIEKNVPELKNPSVKYHYIDSRGKLWSRSIALNIGAFYAKGEILLFSDIDLIFHSDFIKKLLDNDIKRENIYQYRCHYLPQNFNDFNHLNNTNNLEKFEISPDDGHGLMIVNKIKFIEIGGYDNHYKVWGMEDNDLNYRLKKLGMKEEWLNPREFITYHIWHSSTREHTKKGIPNGFQKYLRFYFETNKEQLVRNEPFEKSIIYHINNKQLEINQVTKQIDLSVFSPTFLNEILKSEISNLKEGETVKFKFCYELTKAEKYSLIVNRILKKIRIPFRILTNGFRYGYRNELYDFKDVIIYFLIFHSSEFKNYYFSYSEKKLEFFVKK